MYSRTYDNRMGVLKKDLHTIPKQIDGSWRCPFPEPTFRWQLHLNALIRDPDYSWQRLWAMVLAQAVQEVQGTVPDRGRSQIDDYPEAAEWMAEKDETYALGSFDGVCLALDLDADTIRNDLGVS